MVTVTVGARGLPSGPAGMGGGLTRQAAVPGGVVTVTVAATVEVVRVEVTDRIGDGVPVLPSAPAPADGEADGSRVYGW